MDVIVNLLFGSGLINKLIKTLFLIGCVIAVGFPIWDKHFSEEATNKKIGEKYEKIILQYLKEFLGVEAYHHLLFTKRDKTTSETDIAFATRKGVFCVECKFTSYYVKPQIALSMKQWNMGRYMLNNPFNQNDEHIELIKDYLSDIPSLKNKSVRTFNLVCVNFDYIFKRYMTEYDSSVHPYVSLLEEYKALISTTTQKQAKNAFTAFLEDVKQLPDIFTDAEVSAINQILSLHVATKEQMEKHIEDIKRRKYEQTGLL